ncbi:hypothetical protein WA026_013226 [Henosepilachna vigintioctopunctata]|uniref:Dual specificity protein phosphatase 23 n=1 Tax=Henosepilachna vigintioctopunctata TaxID=420089 RepID=A0AAW1ULH2_9CUCU
MWECLELSQNQNNTELTMWDFPSSKIISYPPYNFSWVENNKLAAMACPTSESNFQFLIDQGIRHIITLSPENVPPKIKNMKLNWTMIDVEEFEAPSIENIVKFINICEKCHSVNHAVGIHCRMGRGRTGVMAACYLVHFKDLPPEKAITNVRLTRPGSIETFEQERAVKRYHDYRRGLITT